MPQMLHFIRNCSLFWDSIQKSKNSILFFHYLAKVPSIPCGLCSIAWGVESKAAGVGNAKSLTNKIEL